MEDTEGEVADSSGLVRRGGKSGRAVRPIRHTARASPYTQRGISLGGDPEPVWNTGGHLPPARPCLAGPSPLGKILQNLQGRGLSPRIIPSRLSSTSLIRLRILLLFSPKRLSLLLSLVSQFVEYKISPRTFPFPYLFVTGTVISFELIKNSKNNPIKLSLSLSLSRSDK